MTKVIIEIDEKGWLLKVNMDGKTFEERGIITEMGATHTGNINDLDEIDSDLCETVTSGFYLYDVADLLSQG